MAKLFANSGDPDKMPCSVASDLGLHCLGVSRLQWVIGDDPFPRTSEIHQ